MHGYRERPTNAESDFVQRNRSITTRVRQRKHHTSHERLWKEIRRLMPGRSVLPDSFVFTGEALGTIERLSARIIPHLHGRCELANDGRSVAETHRLVYIPARIGGEDISIAALRAFAAESFGNLVPLFSHFVGISDAMMEATPLRRGRWVLEYASIVPASTCFSEGNPLPPQYRDAQAIEHLGIIVLSALANSERLFTDTYGRTADRFISGEPVCIGNLHGSRPIAPNNELHRARVGRVVVWEL